MSVSKSYRILKQTLKAQVKAEKAQEDCEATAEAQSLIKNPLPTPALK